MRPLVLACAIALATAAVAPSGRSSAQMSPDSEVAQEFLALELAGWRLPDPTEECLTGLTLRRLEPMAYGSEDLIDDSVLADDDFVQFFHHDFVVAMKFFEEIVEIAFFCHGRIPMGIGVRSSRQAGGCFTE